jgi:very-short-patch-repair endonuclease
MNNHLNTYAAHNRLGTPAENALWVRLRRCQLGVHFRRQVPLLDRYIVDFYARSARLVVEVDGGYHAVPRIQRRDERRERRLRAAGISVMRVSNELVLGQPNAAVELIRCALREGAARVVSR